MSENLIKNYLKKLNNLHNKILAGKAAINEEDVIKLCNELEQNLIEIVNNNFFEDSDEVMEALNGALYSASIGDFAKNISSVLN